MLYFRQDRPKSLHGEGIGVARARRRDLLQLFQVHIFRVREGPVIDRSTVINRVDVRRALHGKIHDRRSRGVIAGSGRVGFKTIHDGPAAHQNQKHEQYGKAALHSALPRPRFLRDADQQVEYDERQEQQRALPAQHDAHGDQK